VSHPVTAVLLNFRSYDTLLEVAVLLVAILAALALQPDETLRQVPYPTQTPTLLDLLVRVLVPVVLVVAGWLLVAGSFAPGGAFQAGAVLAGALLLLRLGGWPAAVPSSRWLRPALAVGLAGFLALAYLTVLLGSGWLHLDPAWAGEAIIALETLLTLSIGMTLAGLFVADQEPQEPPSSGDTRAMQDALEQRAAR
jgi:multisubunit Na+/H+ antiporter MnhB subunit